MLQEILQDVKNAVGGRLVVTPAELEAIMGIPVGHQANMRSENRFPIPDQKTGRKVHYSVHAVAKHLAGRATAIAKETLKETKQDKPPTRLQKKNATNHLASGWWLTFNVRLTALFQNGVLATGQHSAKFKGL